MNDMVEDDGQYYEHVVCSVCNGSGEGFTVGLKCLACDGDGLEYIEVDNPDQDT